MTSDVQQSILGSLTKYGAMSEHALRGAHDFLHPSVISGALVRLMDTRVVVRDESGYFCLAAEERSKKAPARTSTAPRADAAPTPAAPLPTPKAKEVAAQPPASAPAVSVGPWVTKMCRRCNQPRDIDAFVQAGHCKVCQKKANDHYRAKAKAKTVESAPAPKTEKLKVTPKAKRYAKKAKVRALKPLKAGEPMKQDAAPSMLGYVLQLTDVEGIVRDCLLSRVQVGQLARELAPFA